MTCQNYVEFKSQDPETQLFGNTAGPLVLYAAPFVLCGDSGLPSCSKAALSDLQTDGCGCVPIQLPHWLEFAHPCLKPQSIEAWQESSYFLIFLTLPVEREKTQKNRQEEAGQR